MNKVVLLTVIAALGGALMPIVGKIGLEVFDPFTLIFLRFGMSVAVLWFLIPKGTKGFSTARELGLISFIGAINPILFFIALQFTDATIVPIIYGVVPMLTAGYSYVFLKERLSAAQNAGLLIGLGGVSLITALPLLAENPDLAGFWANGLILIAAACISLFGIWSKEKQHSLDLTPETVIYHFSLMSFVISVPLMIYEVSQSNPVSLVETRHIFAAIGIAVCSLVSYIAYQHVLKTASATAASVVSYIQPVFTAIFAVAILSEQLTVSIVAGGATVLYGAWLVQNNKPAKA